MMECDSNECSIEERRIQIFENDFVHFKVYMD